MPAGKDSVAEDGARCVDTVADGGDGWKAACKRCDVAEKGTEFGRKEVELVAQRTGTARSR